MASSSEKVAVVTGASRGIGRAVAVRLAKDGVFVVVHCGRDREAADDTVRTIETGGGQALAVQADLGSLEGVEALFEATDQALEERTGGTGFDILVNNAGFARGDTIEKTTEEDFDEMVAVNLKAPFFIIKAALSRLRDGGRIINISSGTTLFAYPENLAYAMTKGGLNTVTRGLAKQLGPRGITVNAVAPGIIDTEFHHGWLDDPKARRLAASVSVMGRVGEPGDIAEVVAFLASPGAGWVTGALIDATGGSRL